MAPLSARHLSAEPAPPAGGTPLWVLVSIGIGVFVIWALCSGRGAALR